MFILATARLASLTCLRAILTWRSGLRTRNARNPRRFETLPDSLKQDVGLDFWPR